MPEVLLRSLSKSFTGTRGDRHTVLHDVGFTVADGEFAAILGPSGCGKSTTLRIVAGLDRADSGELLIGGRDVSNVPSAERGLGMVFQNYALFPHLSVAENITFGLKVRRVGKAERNERLLEAARQLQLEPYLNRKPGQLSGGQRQRVALGRALVGGSRLILMDEPLSNLDARLRADMRTEIRELQQRLGLTVLYVTHDQVEAMTMADKVIVMREGFVDQISAPENLYAQPANAHVARFIGAPPMSVIEVRRDRDALLIGEDVRIPADALLSRYGHDLPENLLLGIRPEDLVPGTAASADAFTLPGALERQELLGADRLATYGVGGQRLRVRVRAAHAVPAQSVLSASLEHVHLFAAEDSVRIPEATRPILAQAS
ncbi:ABC transporter ATP-binding protein [Mycetocola tolaasinivorans]|uniref:ABC transporter ATP-binding protein n=1 Tax=Mycetocola tolaasinivorans TaxID=76635 RepID=UPI001600A18E|nr:ATP-binding cassette domain-containing protein [Mycetocola tolaasinivorans]